MFIRVPRLHGLFAESYKRDFTILMDQIDLGWSYRSIGFIDFLSHSVATQCQFITHSNATKWHSLLLMGFPIAAQEVALAADGQ